MMIVAVQDPSLLPPPTKSTSPVLRNNPTNFKNTTHPPQQRSTSMECDTSNRNSFNDELFASFKSICDAPHTQDNMGNDMMLVTSSNSNLPKLSPELEERLTDDLTNHTILIKRVRESVGSASNSQVKKKAKTALGFRVPYVCNYPLGNPHPGTYTYI